MSIASLAGYLNNGGGDGGDTFDTITIGYGKTVELTCERSNRLSVLGIQTDLIQIFNEDGISSALTCPSDGILAIDEEIVSTQTWVTENFLSQAVLDSYLTIDNAETTYQPKENFTIGYYKNSFTFGSIPNTKYANFTFNIPNFQTTQNSVITLSNNSLTNDSTAGVSYSVYYTNLALTPLIQCTVYNYSGKDLLNYRFDYSVIAIIPI